MPDTKDAAALAAAQDRIGEMTRSFMQSRILLSAVELGVFRAVADGADTADSVARAIDADPRATAMLLDALTAIDLMEKQDGRYRLSATSAACFGPGVPAFQGQALMHAVRLWESWSRLSDCVRLGHPPERPQMDNRDDEGLRGFIAAMHSYDRREADAVVAHIDLARRAPPPGPRRRLRPLLHRLRPRLPGGRDHRLRPAGRHPADRRLRGRRRPLGPDTPRAPATCWRTTSARAATWSGYRPSATCSRRSRTSPCCARRGRRWRPAAG